MATCLRCKKDWKWDWDQDVHARLNEDGNVTFAKVVPIAGYKENKPPRTVVEDLEVEMQRCDCGKVLALTVLELDGDMEVYSCPEWATVDWAVEDIAR